MPVCTRTVCSHAAGSLPAQAGHGRRSKESGGRQHARGGLPEQSARRLCADRVRDSRRERESESRVKREARAGGRNAWHTLTSMSFAPPWYTIHRKTSEVSVVFAAIPKHSTCAGGTITRSAHACAAHTTSAVMTAYTVLRGAIVLAGAEFAVRMRCGEGERETLLRLLCTKNISDHTRNLHRTQPHGTHDAVHANATRLLGVSAARARDDDSFAGIRSLPVGTPPCTPHLLSLTTQPPPLTTHQSVYSVG